MSDVIECAGLVRIYRTGGLEVQALQGLDLTVAEGEFLAMVGASGSGKSTLLGILAGLDAPSAGSVRVDGRELAGLTRAERAAYRRRTVGFVWQNPSRNLLPNLTALENVALPQRFVGTRRRARRARAGDLLDAMGVGYCAGRTPGRLSGGEQQRVAIAVALSNAPRVLLADEPTGEVDSDTAREVLAALRAANTEFGTTTVVVTHDEDVAAQVHRTVEIRDGRTATETHRRLDGEDREDGVQYAVVDRSGRLQLPREFTDPLGIRDLVRLSHEPGHVGVWPSARPPAGRDGAGRIAEGAEIAEIGEGH
jgi:ABC-type lipoprotein export system ATPase subunit